MRYLFITVLLSSSLAGRTQQKSIYYPSGLVQYNYQLQEGKLHGEFISYYENGLVKSKGSLVGGQKQGTWNSWDKEGMLRTRRNYHDNVLVDLVNEWNNTGCVVAPGYLESKKLGMQQQLKHDEQPIYVQRYWETLAPGPGNEELFSANFFQFLQKGISENQITAFTDDRFTSPTVTSGGNAILQGIPDEYIIKTDHRYFASRQQMYINIMGLGLKYKGEAGERVVWLYFPELKSKLERTFLTIADKFAQHSFLTTQIMTSTWSKGQVQLVEKEKLAVLLAEIDFETAAWVYLLDKDLK